jgi:NAD-dependent deacetylase
MAWNIPGGLVLDNDSLKNRIDTVARSIASAQNVVFFTGAGISTESGIPDFRGPGGIWERFNPDDFTYQRFISSAETRRRWWLLFRERGLSGEIKPNAAHYALAELERMGKLAAVITQNIDNLHQTGGVPGEMVIELHGNIQWTACISCGRRYYFDDIIRRLAAGDEAPGCMKCGGILKPGIVFFGEMLPEGVFDKAMDLASRADLFIVVGSTLAVYPAAQIPLKALDAGAKLVIINLTPTPLDDRSAVTIRSKAGEAMTGIVARLRRENL